MRATPFDRTHPAPAPWSAASRLGEGPQQDLAGTPRQQQWGCCNVPLRADTTTGTLKPAVGLVVMSGGPARCSGAAHAASAIRTGACSIAARPPCDQWCYGGPRPSRNTQQLPSCPAGLGCGVRRRSPRGWWAGHVAAATRLAARGACCRASQICTAVMRTILVQARVWRARLLSSAGELTPQASPSLAQVGPQHTCNMPTCCSSGCLLRRPCLSGLARTAASSSAGCAAE